jgi:hypothetical protein
MALTVKVDHPDFPEGMEFGINGLGLFENGTAREVTEDEERNFAAENQVGAGDVLGQSAYLDVSGSPIITDLEEVLGVDVTSTPSADPTAMNIDPTTGEVFEHANLNGISSDPEVTPLEEEEETVITSPSISTPTTPTTLTDTTTSTEGGDS